MDVKKVKLDNGKVLSISKLPLKKYAELVKQIRSLPKHVEPLANLSKEEIMLKLPDIIASALPDFIGLITIATDLKAEEVEELGLAEVVEIVIAVFEINRYGEIYERAKKAMAQMQAPPREETPEEKPSQM